MPTAMYLHAELLTCCKDRVAFAIRVSRAGEVMGTIRGSIQEAASIHMQSVHIILDNSGHHLSRHRIVCAPRGEIESGFHQARIDCSCIPSCALVTRVAFGDAVSIDICKFQIQSSVVGWCKCRTRLNGTTKCIKFVLT